MLGTLLKLDREEEKYSDFFLLSNLLLVPPTGQTQVESSRSWRLEGLTQPNIDTEQSLGRARNGS